MIKVLIAEDELPLLRGMKKMIEHLNPQFKVVECAKNGKEALNYLEENQVDVIFTDINMPIMNGFDIINYASNLQNKVQTVIVSGYNEFSYAKRAIEYGVINYLLKPIEREELRALLIKIEEDLKKDIYEQKDKILMNYIFGTEREIGHDMFQNKLYLFYFCAGSAYSHLKEELSKGNEYWNHVTLKALASELTETKSEIFTYWGRNLNERILIIEQKKMDNQEEAARSVLDMLPKKLPVTAAFCDGITDLDEIKESIQGLRNQIRKNAVFGTSIVLPEAKERKEIKLSVSQKTAMQFAFKRGQLDELENLLTVLKEQMKRYGVTQSNLEGLLKEILVSLLQVKESKEEEDMVHVNQEAEELIADSYDLDMLFSDFVIICKNLKKNIPMEGGQDLMVKVDEYISKNISSSLTTKMLAEKFGLVAPYLSRLFKQYKGVSPAQYIQNMRIEWAKELLIKCPDMLAKDIAEAVGYNNSLYFSKTFKKNVGVYPSVYRSQYKVK